MSHYFMVLSFGKSSTRAWLAVASISVIEFLAFRSYVLRELDWNPLLHGDPTWYTFNSFEVFDTILRGQWPRIHEIMRGSPWGILLHIEATIIYLLFGVSRLTLLLPNFLHYILFQVSAFIAIHRMTRSYRLAFAAMAVTLTVLTPFRTGALNIRDYHYDFPLFCLEMALYMGIIASGFFQSSKKAVGLGIFAGYIVGKRLVSCFFHAGVFGIFFPLKHIYVLTSKKLSKTRGFGKKFLGAMIATTLVPLIVGGKNFSSHYFRFVTDKNFWNERKALYAMGTDGNYFESIKVLLDRVFFWDLGTQFLKVSAFMVALVALAAWQKRRKKTLIDEVIPKPQVRLIQLFCLSIFLGTAVPQILFPAKSDHLTRMTALAFIVFVICDLIPRCAPLLSNKRLSMALILPTFWYAFANQSHFYARSSGYMTSRPNIEKAKHIFDDMDRICTLTRWFAPKISVDFIDEWALGGALTFSSYQYMKSGMLYYVNPRLGGSPDLFYTEEESLEFLSDSDIVLHMDPASVADDLWPMNVSLKPLRPVLQEFIRTHFAHYKRYHISSTMIDLYFRYPQEWVSPYPRSLISSDPQTAQILTPAGGNWTPQFNGRKEIELQVEVNHSTSFRDIQISFDSGSVAAGSVVVEGSDLGERWVQLGSLKKLTPQTMGTDLSEDFFARRLRLRFLPHTERQTQLRVKRIGLSYARVQFE